MDEQSRRKLIVSLPNRLYCVLEAQAAVNDRVAAQQAAHLLRTVLEGFCEDVQQHRAVMRAKAPEVQA
jgi:hypothetical protein